MEPLNIQDASPITFISGGQTGADRAGLDAAYRLRIPTAGYVPKGFITENGPDFTLKRYNVTEHDSDKYPPRTRANIKAADITIIMSPERQSRGTKLALEACVEFDKPHLILTSLDQDDLRSALTFFHFFPHRVINIAGNRESAHPGLHIKAGKFLLALMAVHLRQNGWLAPDYSGRSPGRFLPPKQ